MVDHVLLGSNDPRAKFGGLDLKVNAVFYIDLEAANAEHLDELNESITAYTSPGCLRACATAAARPHRASRRDSQAPLRRTPERIQQDRLNRHPQQLGMEEEARGSLRLRGTGPRPR